MHVYDLLIVEMFRVELRVDPSTLPSWITLDTLNDNPCVKLGTLSCFLQQRMCKFTFH